ncbi:hypothetical protein F5Y11DRAFT_324332 [Daldinia sp. FL1419]|nr:hypothetical protein F5Y11DRAFT_324332 [Daldinia sp. FL1419]
MAKGRDFIFLIFYLFLCLLVLVNSSPNCTPHVLSARFLSFSLVLCADGAEVRTLRPRETTVASNHSSTEDQIESSEGAHPGQYPVLSNQGTMPGCSGFLGCVKWDVLIAETVRTLRHKEKK